MKRILDVTAAATGVIVLVPLFAIVALAIKLDSPGPVFFRQTRLGRGFRPFEILKFRTMTVDAPSQGPAITTSDDRRITRVGTLLRLTKVDELPQLLNVLRGDMSLVGPRPEVPKYVELFRRDYEEILAARPGITDLASMKYRHEADLLSAAAEPEQEYVSRILPDKIALAKQYVRRASLTVDLLLLARTMLSVVEGSLPSLRRVQR